MKQNRITSAGHSSNTNVGRSFINLSGRTKKQQEKVDAELLRKGSLWPKFEILYQFVFTRKEMNAVINAYKVIDEHKKKRLALAGS